MNRTSRPANWRKSAPSGSGRPRSATSRAARAIAAAAVWNRSATLAGGARPERDGALMARSIPSSRSGRGGRSARAARPRNGCSARRTCWSGSCAPGLMRNAWAARSSALAMAAPSRATNARAPASSPNASAARTCADGRPASCSSSCARASAFAVWASVQLPACRTKIFRSSTLRTANCLVWASHVRRPSRTARHSVSSPAATRAIACWFAMSALPRNARASRTISSPLEPSSLTSRPSSRSRYSPASRAKKSDMPRGFWGGVMRLPS